MFRSLFVASSLFLAAPAWACPFADAAAFAEASAKVQATEGEKANFTVKGLTCGDCSNKVVKALNGIEGVLASAVDYQNGRAEVAFDKSKTNTETLRKTIVDTGYEAETVVKEG